jgi:hypothetical protein
MAAPSLGVACGTEDGVMGVVYKPTHKMVGQNAISIEYELRKLSQTLAAQVANMDANRLGIFGKRD